MAPQGKGPTERDAAQLRDQIHRLGDYGHVSVRVQRGHLIVANEEEPVARLTPLGGGRYGLSFHNHTGRWEPMPFTGDLVQQARSVVDALGAYLERWEYRDINSGSDH